MQASGLDNTILAQIWEASDVEEPKGQLVQSEFFVALKLIALQQCGLEPVPTNVTNDSALPMIGTFTAEIEASLAPPAPEPVAAPELVMNDAEAQAYPKFWSRAAPAGNEFIGPGEAVGFFQSSGLDNTVLGAVWDIADASDPKGQLNAAEFNVALKLIAVKQAGLEPTMENIGTETPLPALAGHTEAVQQELAGDKNVDLAKRLWGMASANLDADQCLDGGTLRPLLMTSKLDAGQLGDIWAKADVGSMGKLNYAQFEDLLRFISQAQRGDAIDAAGFSPAMPPAVLEGL
jgi:hypothetical protein